MTDQIVTLTPIADYAAPTGDTITGGSHDYSVTSDNSDSTYVSGNGTTGVFKMQVSAAGLVVPTIVDQIIIRVRTNNISAHTTYIHDVLTGAQSIVTLPATTTRATAADGHTSTSNGNISSATANFQSSDVGADISGTGIPANATITGVTDSTHAVISANGSSNQTTSTFTIRPIQTLSCSAATDVGGEGLTPALAQGLGVEVHAENGRKIFEVYVDVYYNQAPTVSAVGPTGSVDAQQPTISWTYSDPEGDAQVQSDVIIDRNYSGSSPQPGNGFYRCTGLNGAPQITIGAEPPGSTIVGSGVGAGAHPPPVKLPIGSYRVFVRTADRQNPGASTWRYSGWSFADFTVAAALPAMPQVIAGAYDPVRGRIPLTVQGFDNLLSDSQALSASSPTIGDWNVTNASKSLVTTATRLWTQPGPNTHSLELTSTASGAMTAVTPSSGGIPVQANMPVIAGAHCWADNAADTVAKIQFYDINGAPIGSPVVGLDFNVLSGSAPTTVFVVATAPSNATQAVVTIDTSAPSSSWHFWIADAFIMPTVLTLEGLASQWSGNQVTNTSFETWAGSSGAADWHFVAGAGQTTAVVADAAAPDGANCLRIAKPDTTVTPPYGEFPDSTASANLIVSGGEVVIVCGFVKSSSGPGLTVEAVWSSGTDSVQCAQQSTGDWEPFVAAFQVPNTVTTCNIRLLPVPVGATGTSGEVRVDLVNIYVAASGSTLKTKFTADGGASGTPKGAGLGSVGKTPFNLAVAPQPWFPWIRGGLLPNLTFTVQRSIDGGATWTDVRGIPQSPVTGFVNVGDSITPASGADVAALWDYEVPPNTTVIYIGATNSIDPTLSSPVSSPLTPPLPDAGFEQQTWNGLDTLLLDNSFQPVYGSMVGAIVAPSAGVLGSFLGQPSPIPAWAATVTVRLLARQINANPFAVLIVWKDEQGQFGWANNVNLFFVAGGAGDTGWAWYESSPIAIPPWAASAYMSANGPSAASAGPQLTVFDAWTVIYADALGNDTAASVPACEMWLKDPLVPGLNLQLDIEANQDQVSSTSDESMLVVQGADRSDPVILSDVIQSELLGGMQFILVGDSQAVTFDALRATQHTLLVQLPTGDLTGEQHYVRLGPQRKNDRIVTQDQNTQQKRRITIDAREVAAP